MKIRELRQKSSNELEKLLMEKRSRLLSLKFDLSGGRVKNIREMRNVRRDISQILTLLGQIQSQEKTRVVQSQR